MTRALQKETKEQREQRIKNQRDGRELSRTRRVFKKRNDESSPEVRKLLSRFVDLQKNIDRELRRKEPDEKKIKIWQKGQDDLDRQIKALSHSGEKRHVIDLTDRFRELGVDYAQWGKHSGDRVVELWHGRNVKHGYVDLSQETKDFLKANFDISFRNDDFKQTHICFNLNQTKRTADAEVPGNLIRLVAEQSGEPRTVVECVYRALVEICRKSLREKRRAVLHGLCSISVKYKPESEYFKEENRTQIPDKSPAKNVLRARVTKDLHNWVGGNVPVEPLPKVEKQGKKKRRKKTKYKSVHEEQKEFHIA